MSDFVREYAAGTDADPLRPLQRRSEVRHAGRARRGLWRRPGGDRATTRASHRDEASGRYQLLRGRDASKDQSYFLFTLTQAQLAHAVFPLGELDKPAVREHARALDLAVADKPDSHEICFVASGDHAAFLEEHGVGRGRGHDPERRGRRRSVSTPASTASLSVSARGSACPPRFRSTWSGSMPRLRRSPSVRARRWTDSELTASGVNWIAGVPPAAGTRVTAQIRHRHKEAAATIDPVGGDRVAVRFDAAASRRRARPGAGDVSGG